MNLNDFGPAFLITGVASLGLFYLEIYNWGMTLIAYGLMTLAAFLIMAGIVFIDVSRQNARKDIYCVRGSRVHLKRSKKKSFNINRKDFDCKYGWFKECGKCPWLGSHTFSGSPSNVINLNATFVDDE